MLTVEKLLILVNWKWDHAAFLQAAPAKEKDLMASLDWDEYAGLLQDLMLVTKNLVSKEYAQKVHRQLLAACADEATTQTFIGYASTL